MPAGAIPVPKNSEGKRVNKGYEFHYGKWKHPLDDPTFYREGATKDNLFPPDRRFELDVELLKKMGLTRQRMLDGDALFFQQLLTPLCDPSMSGIDGDPRMGFYCDVSDFTGSYAFSKKKLSGGRRSTIHAEINDITKRGRIQVVRISHYTIMMSRHNQIISAA